MKKINLILESEVIESKNVKSLLFFVEDGEKINFKAGQYLNLFFPNDKNEHGKSYTISSVPNKEQLLRITVKKIGFFSEKLHCMKKGDSVYAVGPFGFMTLDEVEDKKKDIIFIAGGIGITAFYPLIEESINKNKIIKNFLFYSIKKKDDIIFYDEFKDIEKNNNFEVKYFFSNEKENKIEVKNNNFFYNKLDIDFIKKNTDFDNSNFFICGTVEFVNFFWKELKNKKVNEDDIYTESFFIC